MAVGKITSRAIESGAITTDQLATGAVKAIDISDNEISMAKLSQVDLTIAPEVLEIQVDAPDMGQDTMWKWTWEQSTLPYARRTITNSNELNVPLYKEGTYVVNNFAAYDIHGSMTQTHSLYLKWIDGAGTDNLVSWATSAGPISDTHPDINGGNATDVQRITVNVPATISLPSLTNPSVSYTVVNNASGGYTFSGSAKGDNPNLGPFYRGGTYTVNINATGHPFYFTTDNGTNFSAGTYFGEYTSGVTGSRTDSGTITFTVPSNAPDTLYYQCGNHSAMRGAITVKDLAVETNINGNYVVYFQHTQEGHRTPVELRPIPSLVNQMCLVYDNNTNKFVPQDLATYVENTPSFENKIREVAGTAELVVEDGSAVIAKVNVYDDSTYLPLTGNNPGDQAFATDTDILYIWDGSAWQQAGAANSDDLTEGTTNLFFTNARVASYLSSNDFDTATNIVAAITDSAPATLDTLNELAAALGDDPNFATTTATNIAAKLPLAGGAITGDVTISSDADNSDGNLKVITNTPSNFPAMVIQTSTGGNSTETHGLYIKNTAAGHGLRIDDASSDTSPFVVNYDGNVGIGTTLPTAKLHIQRAVYGGYNALQLENTNGNAGVLNYTDLQMLAGGSTGKVILRMENSSASGLTDGELAIHTTSSGSTTERMRINSLGNVGIGGEQNPQRSVVVKGANSSTTSIQFQTPATGSAASDGFGVGYDSNGKGFIWNYESSDTYIGGTTSGTAVTIQGSSGDVGIGTSSMEGAASAIKVEVDSGSNHRPMRLRFVDDNNGATNNPLAFEYKSGLEIENAYSGAAPSANGTKIAKLSLTTVTSSGYGATGSIFVTTNAGTGHNSGELVFAVGHNSSGLDTEAMRINKDGLVGIGTSTPNAKLDVEHAAAGTIAKFFDTGSNGGAQYNGAPVVGISRVGNGSVSLAGPLFQVGNDTSTSNAYNIDDPVFTVTNTNVGIGTTQPLDKLVLTVGNGGGILQSTYVNGTVTSGMKMGAVGFKGYSSGNTTAAADAKIEGVADGDHTGSSAPSRLDFYTKPTSVGPGSGPVRRFRIDRQGGQHVEAGPDGWSRVQHTTNEGMNIHHKRYGVGASAQTLNILRVRRHYWGSGTFKITCRQSYYVSTEISTFYLTGHGRSDGSYNVSYGLGYDNEYNGNSGRCSINVPGGSPGNADAEIVDVRIYCPAYTYWHVIVEVGHSAFYEDVNVMPGVNSYALH